MFWPKVADTVIEALLSMQERVLLAGGELEVISTPRRGTEIRVRFPL